MGSETKLKVIYKLHKLQIMGLCERRNRSDY